MKCITFKNDHRSRFKTIITVVLLFSLLSFLQSAASPKPLSLSLSPFFEVGNVFIKDSLKYIRITGRVIAKEDGLPISGAKIKVKGIDVITWSDHYGKFTLNIPDTSYHIIINFKGYKKEDVPFIGDNYHDISLKPSSPVRDPVVIDSNYRKKYSLTQRIWYKIKTFF